MRPATRHKGAGGYRRVCLDGMSLFCSGWPSPSHINKISTVCWHPATSCLPNTFTGADVRCTAHNPVPCLSLGFSDIRHQLIPSHYRTSALYTPATPQCSSTKEIGAACSPNWLSLPSLTNTPGPLMLPQLHYLNLPPQFNEDNFLPYRRELSSDVFHRSSSLVLYFSSDCCYVAFALSPTESQGNTAEFSDWKTRQFANQYHEKQALDNSVQWTLDSRQLEGSAMHGVDKHC
ncbi:hypothetical protein J6590_037734 [Homalodisca vitripennis]|nr:hypothetical protein J6590_037734 [Homalodisca vitripennis]